MSVFEKLFVLALLCLLAACQRSPDTHYLPEFSDQPPQSGIVYLFGVHPLHNPQHLYEVFEPLMAYLNAHISDVEFQLEASRDYASYDAKLYARHFQFALPNPFQTINAVDRGYRVFAKMGDDEDFRGIILVRRDSAISDVNQLRGKAVSYPAPTALAATMLPQYFLQTHGVDVQHDITNLYVGSQESSIMNVYLGRSAAGATWPPPWRAFTKARPELASQLQVQWQTQSLPNNGVVALPDVPDTVVSQVRDLLVHLHEHPEGRVILKRMELSRFEAADAGTYQPIRDFVRRFSQTVRPLEGDQ